MPPLKPIAAFFGKVVLVYVLLLLPWPGLRDSYAAVFRSAGNLAFRTFGANGRVYFAPAENVRSAHDAKDTDMTLESIRTRVRATMEINTRLMGYLPTAFAAALILATPIPWRRRTLAFVIGVLLMSVFAGTEVLLRLLDAFTDNNPLNLYAFPSWAKGTVRVLLLVLGKSPVTAYVAPVLVWALVAFRRGDLSALLAPSAAPAPADSARKPRRAVA